MKNIIKSSHKCLNNNKKKYKKNPNSNRMIFYSIRWKQTHMLQMHVWFQSKLLNPFKVFSFLFIYFLVLKISKFWASGTIVYKTFLCSTFYLSKPLNFAALTFERIGIKRTEIIKQYSVKVHVYMFVKKAPFNFNYINIKIQKQKRISKKNWTKMTIWFFLMELSKSKSDYHGI